MGQRTDASIDVGALALRYADTLNASAAAVSAHALFDSGQSAAEALGTFSQFASDGWSSQGAISASVFSPASRGLFAEVGGFAGGSTHQDGTRTGEILGNLRLHYMRGGGELFVGAGAGRTSFGDGPKTVWLGEAGVSARIGEIDATIVTSPVAVDSLKYVDSQLSVSLTRAKVEFDALLGFRVGDQLTGLGATAKAWGSLNAVAWVTPHLAVVLSGGSYPIDPTQGFPGARFVSASIRLGRPGSQQRQSVARAQAQDSAVLANAADVERFYWEKSGAEDVTLSVTAPRAQVVEVSGDFTNWIPIRLAPAGGGQWSVTLPLKPGKYQMNLRINGGNWLVPPGLLAMSDEFGGTVGLLVVE